MRAEQTVSEMVVESLARQAEVLSEEMGRHFKDAFADVLKTPAGWASLPTVSIDTRRPPSGRPTC